MPLVPGSIIFLTQQPAKPLTYSDSNNGLVVEANSHHSSAPFTRIDFDISGINFRKSVVNNRSYIDLSYLLHGLSHTEVDEYNIYFAERNQVVKPVVQVQAYTTKNDWSVGIGGNYTLINSKKELHNVPSEMYFVKGQNFFFASSLLGIENLPAPFVPDPQSNLKLHVKINGTIIDTYPVDLTNAGAIDLEQWCARVPQQSINKFKDKDNLQLELEFTDWGGDIFKNQSNVVHLHELTSCPIDNMVEVAFINKANRWECVPFTNRASYSLTSKQNIIKVVDKGFNYSSNKFEVNQRPTINNVEHSWIVDLETSYQSDGFNLKLSELVASRYHTLFIGGKKYFAQIKDNSWSENVTGRDGLKTFTTKFEVFNYGV